MNSVEISGLALSDLFFAYVGRAQPEDVGGHSDKEIEDAAKEFTDCLIVDNPVQFAADLVSDFIMRR